MEIWRKTTAETSRIEHIKANEAVLNEVDEERTVMNTIIKRKIKLVSWTSTKTQRVLRGRKIAGGKRSRGRPRESCFEEIFRWMGLRVWNVTGVIGYINKPFDADDDGGYKIVK